MSNGWSASYPQLSAITSGRQVGDPLGVVQDHVAPEHHPPAVAADQAVHPAEEVEVDAGDAVPLGRGPAAALADVERLVAADVEQTAVKVRQQLGVQPGQESTDAGSVGHKLNGPSHRNPHGVSAPSAASARWRYRGCFSHRSMCPNEFWFGTSSTCRSRQ